MIYKFISIENANLEVSSIPEHVLFSFKDNKESVQIALNKDQIYNLIGALHSLKSKM